MFFAALVFHDFVVVWVNLGRHTKGIIGIIHSVSIGIIGIIQARDTGFPLLCILPPYYGCTI